MKNHGKDDVFSSKTRPEKSAPIISGDEITNKHTSNRFGTSTGKPGPNATHK